MVDALEVWLDDGLFGGERHVGHLSRSARRGHEVVRFAYDASWLKPTNKVGFALSPELPLTPGDHFPAAGHALPGVFADATPDRWGRLLIERREAADAQAAGRAARQLSEWDFLIGVGDVTRLGALRLRDVATGRFIDDREPTVPVVTHLRELEAAARVLDAPDATAQPGYGAALNLLLQPGTSLGGARPKASFRAEDDTLWLAKFPGHDDRYDVSAWEMLAHRLAQSAGMQVPAARLDRFSPAHHTFCVKRFDRADGARRHFASALAMLGRLPGETASYLDIAQALWDHGDPAALHTDLAELYRRILFGILIGNRDDHLRNHGFLRHTDGWRLAPAFDINPNPDKTVHALNIDGQSPEPRVEALRRTRDLYRLDQAAAEDIETATRTAVAGWRPVAHRLAISTSEQAVLDRIIDAQRP